MTVVSVSNCVQECLADRNLIEGWQLNTEQTVLIALTIIGQVDLVPQRIVIAKEPLAELFAVRRRT
jgi:hypothetical protein